MVVALVFVASIAITIISVYQLPGSYVYRMAVILAVASFGIIAYLTAKTTGLSPFSLNTSVNFGYSTEWPAITVGVLGALSGVLGSYFFNLGDAKINFRSLLRPLATAPLVLIPTIKLIEAAGEQSLLSLLLLFALSYQNGFFWERLLKASPQ